ncbi:hypothetical protein [Kluyvera ascorbata]|uniref:hypothetical protein n=1 Tax=Kluyvera ascorbata TaxID=51288 RepID=UPI0039F64FB8
MSSYDLAITKLSRLSLIDDLRAHIENTWRKIIVITRQTFPSTALKVRTWVLPAALLQFELTIHGSNHQ